MKNIWQGTEVSINVETTLSNVHEAKILSLGQNAPSLHIV